MDPYTQIEYGDFLYNMGLIDDNEKSYFESEEEKIKRYIRIQNWPLATKVQTTDVCLRLYFNDTSTLTLNVVAGRSGSHTWSTR